MSLKDGADVLALNEIHTNKAWYGRLGQKFVMINCKRTLLNSMI